MLNITFYWHRKKENVSAEKKEKRKNYSKISLKKIQNHHLFHMQMTREKYIQVFRSTFTLFLKHILHIVKKKKNLFFFNRLKKTKDDKRMHMHKTEHKSISIESGIRIFNLFYLAANA